MSGKRCSRDGSLGDLNEEVQVHASGNAEMERDDTDSRILVVHDGSQASSRAVEYLAEFVGRRRRFRICLVHVLPPLPTELMEHGGSDDPFEEVRMEHALKVEQDRWIAITKKTGQEDLDRTEAALREAGIPRVAIQKLFCDPGEPKDIAERLLDMANECQCHTIVVGRRSISWLHQLFSREISEELLRRGKGFCIWAVE